MCLLVNWGKLLNLPLSTWKIKSFHPTCETSRQCSEPFLELLEMYLSKLREAHSCPVRRQSKSKNSIVSVGDA